MVAPQNGKPDYQRQKVEQTQDRCRATCFDVQFHLKGHVNDEDETVYKYWQSNDAKLYYGCSEPKP